MEKEKLTYRDFTFDDLETVCKLPRNKQELFFMFPKADFPLTINQLKNTIKDTLKNLDLRFVLDSNYIEVNLEHKHSFFDTVGYTEKPDEVCAKILEGRVALIVDGTSFVITVPYFFMENY